MNIEVKTWGISPDGKEIKLYTMTNSNGIQVQLCDIGAGIVSILTPDREGHFDDIVLGYPDPLSYYGDGPVRVRCQDVSPTVSLTDASRSMRRSTNSI